MFAIGVLVGWSLRTATKEALSFYNDIRISKSKFNAASYLKYGSRMKQKVEEIYE